MHDTCHSQIYCLSQPCILHGAHLNTFSISKGSPLSIWPENYSPTNPYFSENSDQQQVSLKLITLSMKRSLQNEALNIHKWRRFELTVVGGRQEAGKFYKQNKCITKSEPHFLRFHRLHVVLINKKKINFWLIIPWLAGTANHRDRLVGFNNGGSFGSFHFKATGPF